MVTHLGTPQARRCLTSEIGRVPVLSTWYGRKRWRCTYDPQTLLPGMPRTRQIWQKNRGNSPLFLLVLSIFTPSSSYAQLCPLPTRNSTTTRPFVKKLGSWFGPRFERPFFFFWTKRQKLTTPSFPKWSPTLVLPRPDAA